MTLPVRELDDRKFQDIVDEAKKRITASCPEWTDHNVSDPGVTLVELFAWMTEMVIYRLNQVPEKNYIKFLELLGFKLREPKSARTQITFYLSAPQTHDVLITAGTEAATVRTETRPSITFSTDDDLTLHPPALMALFTGEVSSSGSDRTKNHVHVLQQLRIAQIQAFNNPPKIGNAFYLGFSNDLTNHVLGLEITCLDAMPRGIDPKKPPWQWEAWFGGETDQGWLPAIVEEDSTKGLASSGQIRLRLPRMTATTYIDRRGYWLRCRVVHATSGDNYKESPIISDIDVDTWGGTVWATNASVVQQELLGRSDGSPGQIFHTEHAPLLRRKSGETVEVLPPGSTEWVIWTETPDFGDSEPEDKHFTCDSASGEIRFSPALREPEGKVRSFGAIPPRGAQIRLSSYRYGGGVAGNVQAGELKVLKTSIPYVDRLVNHIAATGGVDPETIELLQLRAPKLLRTSKRAVTPADYEALAQDADSRVHRAHCVQSPTAGLVYVLLVPKPARSNSRIATDELRLSDDLREAVRRELDKCRLLTVQLDIREPEYAWVAVDITVAANPNADAARVKAEVEERLYAFLNPFEGGPAKQGWPFGRALYPSDVYACMQGVQGMEFIESVRLYRVQPKTNDRAEITGRLDVPDHALIASAEHQVKVSYVK